MDTLRVYEKILDFDLDPQGWISPSGKGIIRSAISLNAKVSLWY